MMRICALLALVSAAYCNPDAPVTPPIRCGVIPDNVYKCLNNPQILSSNVASQCSRIDSKCDKMKCIFQKSGWLDGDKVNKQKFSQHLDQYAKDHPVWAEEVQQVKAKCLNGDLPVQSVYTNCPAYDIISCTLDGFVKTAAASQWPSSPVCQSARQFVSACPLCPEDCFAPLIPTGSCNACLQQPRF